MRVKVRIREDKLELKTKQLADDFAKLFPKLSFRPEFSWAGTFGVTKDGLPYIGHYEPKPNGLFSLGFCGNGVTFSVIAAEIIRDILLENPIPTKQYSLLIDKLRNRIRKITLGLTLLTGM